MSDKTPEEQEAFHAVLCGKITLLLEAEGADYEASLGALSAVQARLCAVMDNPEGAGIDQIHGFIRYLDSEIVRLDSSGAVQEPN